MHLCMRKKHVQTWNAECYWRYGRGCLGCNIQHANMKKTDFNSLLCYTNWWFFFVEKIWRLEITCRISNAKRMNLLKLVHWNESFSAYTVMKTNMCPLKKATFNRTFEPFRRILFARYCRCHFKRCLIKSYILKQFLFVFVFSQYIPKFGGLE